MKPLSPRAQALVTTLWGWWRAGEPRPGAAEQEVIATLTALEPCAEPAVVPHLLELAFDAREPVARAAARVVDRALAAASSDDLVRLDEWCRAAGSPYALHPKPRWAALQPMDVARLHRFGDAEASVAGVASFHGNGRVREAAVTRLDAIAGGRELPFLLIRLTDWVPQVAERARAAVERRLVPPYAGAFLDALPLLPRLERSARRTQRDLVDRIGALLRAPGSDVLRRGVSSPDRTVRALAYRLAREASDTEPVSVLREMLHDPDTVIRLEALAEATRRLSPEERAPLVPILLADPFPRIRREGLVIAAESPHETAAARIRSALLDPNRVVREVARFYAGRRAQIDDVAAFYRERIRDDAPPRELVAALAGLGEAGEASDAGLVEPYLRHARARVRAASIHALASLDAESYLPRIVETLRDPAAAVTHAARHVLRPRAGRVSAPALADVIRTTPHAHGRLDAIAVAAALGKWESLPFLLTAAADEDERIRGAVRWWLRAWVARQNRTMARPTPEQLRAIRAALDAHHLALERRIEAEIRSILRFWER